MNDNIFDKIDNQHIYITGNMNECFSASDV